jgi:hypothetical protein
VPRFANRCSALRVLAALLITLAITASASSAAPVLHRVSPPDRAYSLLLPPGWRLRDVSYPSDHATHLWWTPRDPLARAVIVLSGCEGCAWPNPAAAVSDAIKTHRISRTVVAFEGPYNQAEADYEDNGLVIAMPPGPKGGGYIRIDLWLPPTQHAPPTRILNSFRLR